MKIAFCFNIKKSKLSLDLKKQVDLEFDSLDVVNSIKKALENLGNNVLLIEADENAFFKLKKLKSKIDIVFNIAEGLWGDARESQIPIFCEILKIPYTHSNPTTHAIALDKAFSKLVLKGAGQINVPESCIVFSKNYKIPSGLKFPLIIKPNKEGSSKGVMNANVVRNDKELQERLKIVSENYSKETLVEEYIEGREFTVAVLGNEDLRVLPIVEQKFDFLPKGMNKIASFELKWIYEDALKNPTDAYDCPAIITKKLESKIIEISKEIYSLLDVRDCARIDYRLDSTGKLYFIEINTLPGINLDKKVISYLPTAARAAGMKPQDLISEILSLACKRYGLNVKH